VRKREKSSPSREKITPGRADNQQSLCKQQRKEWGLSKRSWVEEGGREGRKRTKGSQTPIGKKVPVDVEQRGGAVLESTRGMGLKEKVGREETRKGRRRIGQLAGIRRHI